MNLLRKCPIIRFHLIECTTQPRFVWNIVHSQWTIQYQDQSNPLKICAKLCHIFVQNPPMSLPITQSKACPIFHDLLPPTFFFFLLPHFSLHSSHPGLLFTSQTRLAHFHKPLYHCSLFLECSYPKYLLV